MQQDLSRRLGWIGTVEVPQQAFLAVLKLDRGFTCMRYKNG